jgi:hypothetical protein
MKILALSVLLFLGIIASAQASHGGPDWEHDDPARRVYGGGGG